MTVNESYFFYALFLITISNAAYGKNNWGLGLGVSEGFYANMKTFSPDLILNLGQYFTFYGSFLLSGENLSGQVENAAESENSSTVRNEIYIDEASLVRVLGGGLFRFYLMGGSFNLGVGVYKGQLLGKLSMHSREEVAATVDEKIKYVQTIGSLSIGNIWSWSHFYIGCDWIGITSVIEYKKTTDTDQSSRTTDALTRGLEKFNELVEWYGEKPGLVLLNARIGFIF